MSVCLFITQSPRARKEGEVGENCNEIKGVFRTQSNTYDVAFFEIKGVFRTQSNTYDRAFCEIKGVFRTQSNTYDGAFCEEKLAAKIGLKLSI